MSKIDYQALREAAQNAKDLGGIKNYKRGEKAVAEFEFLITPRIVLAMLDELEAAEALNKHLELAIRKAEGCSEALRRKTEAAEKRIAELESTLNRHYELPDVYDMAIKQFESLAKSE